MEAIILAGGLGTRLSEALPGLPKPLAPIGNRVFLELVLLKLAQSNITQLILSVGYKAELIQQRFGEEFAGIRIRYVVESSPLGTGGALRAALPHIRDSSALVLNGDTYVDIDYQSMLAAHQLSRRRVTIAVSLVNDTSRYGRVVVENNMIIGFAEKSLRGPGLINSGVYVVDKGLLDEYPAFTCFSFEYDVLIPKVHFIRPNAYCTSGYFIDIGIPDDYERAKRELPRVGSQ